MCCGNGGPSKKSSSFQTSSADSFRRKFGSVRARPNMYVAVVAAVDVAAVAQHYRLLSYYVPRISSTLSLVYFKFVVSVPWTKARNLVAPASSTYRTKTEREREREREREIERQREGGRERERQRTNTPTHTQRQRERQTETRYQAAMEEAAVAKRRAEAEEL